MLVQGTSREAGLLWIMGSSLATRFDAGGAAYGKEISHRDFDGPVKVAGHDMTAFLGHLWAHLGLWIAVLATLLDR